MEAAQIGGLQAVRSESGVFIGMHGIVPEDDRYMRLPDHRSKRRMPESLSRA